MVRVRGKRCQHPGCGTFPSFSAPGSKRGEFCFVHKKEGMVNVKSKRCQHPRCVKRPYFNSLGSKPGMFCSMHKKEGMVNVLSKRSQHPGCVKHPSFSALGRKNVEFCSVHKKEGMVDVKSSPRRRSRHQGDDRNISNQCRGNQEEVEAVPRTDVPLPRRSTAEVRRCNDGRSLCLEVEVRPSK